uniref:Helicase-associated domain-containing protein n=1 Tax=Gasterosteus aculeatus aculeatus TaxID=481459 RepID=A0AAQ4Q393_GASAC
QLSYSQNETNCFCLYPEDRRLPTETRPHVVESDVSSTVLFLKRMQIAGLGHCDFIDRPDPEGLMQTLEELDFLAALDNDGNLSEVGIIMSEFPLEAPGGQNCVSEVVIAAAMLTRNGPGSTRGHMELHPQGDHFTLIIIYRAFEQCQQDPCENRYCDVDKRCEDRCLNEDLTDALRRIELPVSAPAFGSPNNTLDIERALLAGFFMQVARDVDGSGNYFILSHKRVAQIHPLSVPKLGLPEWVLFHEHSFSEDNAGGVNWVEIGSTFGPCGLVNPTSERCVIQ